MYIYVYNYISGKYKPFPSGEASLLEVHFQGFGFLLFKKLPKMDVESTPPPHPLTEVKPRNKKNAFKTLLEERSELGSLLTASSPRQTTLGEVSIRKVNPREADSFVAKRALMCLMLPNASYLMSENYWLRQYEQAAGIAPVYQFGRKA